MPRSAMPPALALRRGGESDRAFVRDLGHRTTPDSVSTLRSAPNDLLDVSFDRLIDFAFDRSYVLVIAETNLEGPLGFLLMLDDLPDEVTTLPQGFVAYMAVEPHARRRGIGALLLDAAERTARERGLPCMALMVTEDNVAARELYAQAGYATERASPVQNAVNSPFFRRRALLTVGAIVLALGALWLASRIPRTLTVFVIAAFIAFGVAPVVAWLERRLARGVAIAIVYVGLVTVAIVLALLVVPATLGQIQNVATNSPAYIGVMQRWIDAAQAFMALHFGKTYLPPGYGDLQTLIAARISGSFTTLLASLTDILINTVTAAFIGISALVLSAFFLLRGGRVADPLYALLPAHRRATARALGVELANVFGAFVSGQLALCAITGTLIFSFTLVAGFKFALLLGIIAGIAYAVPFVGMLAAHLIALVLAAPQGLQTVIWVQVIVFTIARVSDNLLVPKIMSESVGVSPIVVMFAVFAGGELFGLPGLLLGIPAAALAKVAWRFFRSGPAADIVAPDISLPEIVAAEAIVPEVIVVAAAAESP